MELIPTIGAPDNPANVRATGTATVLAGEVTDIVIVTPGAGYQTPPTVTISGDGTDATATAYMQVGAINVLNQGTGYSVSQTDVALIAQGSGAKAVANLNDETEVASITMLASGSGYTQTPIVRIQQWGEDAEASAGLTDGEVTSITVDAGGERYGSPPIVTIIGDGTDAEAVAEIGNIASITANRLTWTALESPLEAFLNQFSIVNINRTSVGDLILEATEGTLTIESASTKDGNIRVTAPSITVDGAMTIGDYDSSRDHGIELKATSGDLFINADVGNLLNDTVVRTPLATFIKASSAGLIGSTNPSGPGQLITDALTFGAVNSVTVSTDANKIVSGIVTDSRADISVTQTSPDETGAVLPLTVESITAAGGQVEVISGSNLFIDEINAGLSGFVNLSAQGNIREPESGSDSDTDIIADGLQLYVATGTIGFIDGQTVEGLDTEIGYLTAAAIQGAVYLDQKGVDRTGVGAGPDGDEDLFDIKRILARNDISITATSPIKANYLESQSGKLTITTSGTGTRENFDIALGSVATNQSITVEAAGSVSGFEPVFEEPVITPPLPPATVPPAFQPTFVFDSNVPASVANATRAAALRWSDIITGDLAAYEDVSTGEVIDDIVIDVQIGLLGGGDDGEGGALANAGPRGVRSEGASAGLPYRMAVGIDPDDADNPGLIDIMIHEMGHGIGLFTTSNFTANIPNFPDAYYTGTNAVREYGAIFGATADANGVPVETDGVFGDGTAFVHWDEDALGNEILTGYMNPGSNPISKITVGALEDMGYQVNYDKADDYSSPSAISFPSAQGSALAKAELVRTSTLRVTTTNDSDDDTQRTISLTTDVTTFAGSAESDITIVESNAIGLGETVEGVDAAWTKVVSTNGAVSVTAGGRITANDVVATEDPTGTIVLESTADGITLGKVTSEIGKFTAQGDILDLVTSVIDISTITATTAGSQINLSNSKHKIDSFTATSESGEAPFDRGNISVIAEDTLKIANIIGASVDIVVDNELTQAQLTQVVASQLSLQSLNGKDITFDSTTNAIGAVGVQSDKGDGTKGNIVIASAEDTLTLTGVEGETLKINTRKDLNDNAAIKVTSLTIIAGGDILLNDVDNDITTLDVPETAVDLITIDDGGSGYEPNKDDIVVTFSAPESGTDRATGVAVADENGVVVEILITNSGSGYTALPTLVIDDPTTGTTAAATATNLLATSLSFDDTNDLTISAGGLEVDSIALNTGGTLSQLGPIKAGSLSISHGTTTPASLALTHEDNDVDVLTVTNTGEDITIIDVDGIEIGAGGLTGNDITLTIGGDLTQNTDPTSIVISSSLDVNSSAGSVTLDQDNEISTIEIANPDRPVTFTSTSTTDIGTDGIQGSAIILSADGLTQTGTITGTSLDIVSTGTNYDGESITLNALNSVGSVEIDGSGGPISFTNDTDLVIGAKGITGAFQATGTISTDATGVVDQSTFVSTNAGSGYANADNPQLIFDAPTVTQATGTISADGTGAVDVATFTLTEGGSGYTPGDTLDLTFDAPTATTATGTIAADSSGDINGLYSLPSEVGEGYTPGETVNVFFGASAGVTAIGTAVVTANGTIDEITITTPGSGYGADADVAFTVDAPTVTTAAATATVAANGTIDGTSITFTEVGKGYSASSPVSFTIPAPVIAATGTISADGAGAIDVATFTLTEGGVGYRPGQVLTLTFSDPAGAGGTTAEGTVAVGTDGSIDATTINITVDGDGYSASSLVTFTIPAPEIAASGDVTVGVDGTFTGVTSFTSTYGGRGYTPGSTVTLTFDAPTATTATGTIAADSSGDINGLYSLPSEVGEGYTPGETVNVFFGASAGVTAIGTAVVTANGTIDEITITTPGSGYGADADVAFTVDAPTVTTAAATATVAANGTIDGTSITFTEVGKGYTPSGTVSLTAPAVGDTATATPVIASDGTITAITVTNPGSGYLPSQPVDFSIEYPGSDITLKVSGDLTQIGPLLGSTVVIADHVDGGSILLDNANNDVDRFKGFTRVAEKSLTLHDKDELEVLEVISSDDVTIVAGSTLSITGEITAGTSAEDDGDLSLEATTGNIVIDANLTAEKDRITLNASNGIIDLTDGNVTSHTLVWYAQEAPDWAIEPTFEVIGPNQTSEGNLDLDYSDAVTLAGASAINGHISITAESLIITDLVRASGTDTDDQTSANVTITTSTGDITFQDNGRAESELGDITIDSAGKLIISNVADTVSATATSGTLTIDATEVGPLSTHVTTIDIESTANAAISIDETDGLIIENIQTSAADGITINANGEVTQTNEIIAEKLKITNDGGAVTLTDSDNAVNSFEIINTDTGSTGTNNVAFTNTVVADITSGGITGGDIVLNSAGLTQTGVITGTSLDIANSGGVVTLDENNAVSNVEIDNATRAVAFTNTTAADITSGGITGGDIALNSAGLTQTGVITGTSLDIANSGGVVTLDENNAVSNVEIDNATRAVAFTNTTAADITSGGITGGDIALNSAGLTQTGVITGTSLDIANSGGVVTLDENNAVSNVEIDNATRAVAFTNTTAADITSGGITGGDIVLNSAGLTQTGVITGTSLDIANSGGVVTLDENNAVSNVEIDNATRAVAFTNTTAADITSGGITGGTIVLNSAGLTQTGVITGTSLDIANSGGVVTLDENNAVSNVEIDNATRAVAFTNTTAADITSGGITGGDIVLNSAGLTQTGVITGTSLDIANSGGVVTLDENNAVSNVEIDNATRAVAFTNTTAADITSGGITGGTIVLNSAGLTQTGVITGTSLDIANSGGVVTLDENNAVSNVEIDNATRAVAFTNTTAADITSGGITGGDHCPQLSWADSNRCHHRYVA